MAQPPPTKRAPRKIALIVTVPELLNKVAHNLRGPINDARQMRRLLVDRYQFGEGDVETVTGADATLANILRAFERLIARCGPDDLAVFYYSGHGTQVPDQPPLDEADGLDECLVPADANVDADGNPDPKTLLIDDTLGVLLDRLPTKNVVVMLDACHSGTGTRGGGAAKRWITVKRSPGAPPEDPDAPPATVTTVSDNLGSDLTGPTVLTAAAATETARDSELLRPVGEDDNPNIGAFTFALLEAATRTPNERLSYRQIYTRIGDDLRVLGFQQTPQLEGSGLDTAFLALRAPAGGGSVAPPPVTPHPVTPDGDALGTLSQARVLTVAGGAITVQRVGGGRFVRGSLYRGAGITARIGATTDGGLQATAALTHGAASPALSGQVLSQTAFPADREPLRVAVTGSDTGATQAVSVLARTLDGIRVVPATAERDVDLEAKRKGGQIIVTPVRRQFPLAPLTAADTAALKRAMVAAVDNLQALSLLLQTDNPNPPFALDLKVNGKDGATVHVGDTVEFTLQASADCYVYLIDVDPAGKVTVLFPNKLAPDNRLLAGQTYPMPAPDVYRLRVQGPPGPEVLKAIAARKPLRLPTLAAAPGDFSALAAPALTVSRALYSELRAALGPAPGGDSTFIPTTGWSSDTVFLQVEAPPH